MKVRVPYRGDDALEVEVDDHRVAGVLEANPVAIGDETAVIRRALDNPVDAPRLGAFLSDARDVLFLVNDATRPTPTARVLDVVAAELSGREVRFLVATGNHRAPTEEELGRIFGRHLETFRGRIHAHDARRDEMVMLGRSKNGTEMRVNRMGVEAHKIVIISSVEPHYFAGYTGGRKSFLPGIASHQTITQNHKLALRPEARALRLAGNPVHEDMIDALGTVDKEIFNINTVLDKDHRVYAAVAGDIHASFEQAARRADEVFAAPLDEKADVVVSVVKYPGDINLYQSQKGIDNAKHALREGGILILVSCCREGIGEETFYRLLGSAPTPAAVLDTIEREYVLGYHKAAKMAEINQWASVWAVTDLEPGVLEKIFIRSCASLQQAVDEALAEKGSGARVLFLLDGGLIVPVARSAS